MKNYARFMAGTLLVVIVSAFVIQSYELVRSPVLPSRGETSNLPINHPHYREVLATAMADGIRKQVERYRFFHGHSPDCESFRNDLNWQPVSTPLNGRSDIVALRRDVDGYAAGWVFDEATGGVYPGVVFNSVRSDTRPSLSGATEVTCQ